MKPIQFLRADTIDSGMIIYLLRTAEKKKIAALINMKDATKILEMRYALGDLSDGEFRSMQKELMESLLK